VFADEICFGSSGAAAALRNVAEQLCEDPVPMRGGEAHANAGAKVSRDENGPQQRTATWRADRSGSSACKTSKSSQWSSCFQNVGSRNAGKRVVQNRTAKLLAAISSRHDDLEAVRQNIITQLMMLIKRDRQLLVSVCTPTLRHAQEVIQEIQN
jgi:hypothetical protein